MFSFSEGFGSKLYKNGAQLCSSCDQTCQIDAGDVVADKENHFYLTLTTSLDQPPSANHKLTGLGFDDSYTLFDQRQKAGYVCEKDGAYACCQEIAHLLSLKLS